MATHSSILAWKIPWTEDPGRIQSMGLQRVAGYSPWGHKEWDMTEYTHTHTQNSWYIYMVWNTKSTKRYTMNSHFSTDLVPWPPISPKITTVFYSFFYEHLSPAFSLCLSLPPSYLLPFFFFINSSQFYTLFHTPGFHLQHKLKNYLMSVYRELFHLFFNIVDYNTEN